MASHRQLHWVCFSCRKQIRKTAPANYLSKHTLAQEEADAEPCPICQASMVNMGRFFRPPRHNDKRAWAQMQLLAAHGVRFRSGGVALSLDDLSRHSVRAIERQIVQWSCYPRNEGQRLLQQIARKPLK